MTTQETVLLVGGTGRTGRRVSQQLLDRGISVRAIVRSSGKLPHDAVGNPNLTVVETSLLSLRDEEGQAAGGRQRRIEAHLIAMTASILSKTEITVLAPR